MSYQNMKAEMRRFGVTQGDIAAFLKMSTNNVSLKINGRGHKFKSCIAHHVFPGQSLVCSGLFYCISPAGAN